MCSVPEYFGRFSEASKERDLYEPLINFLYSHFGDSLKSRHGFFHITAQDVSTITDGEGGQWSRPDVAAIVLRRNRYAATASIDILSFEVKRYNACDLPAVHETLAHARFVNFAYLVWNRPACTCGDQKDFDRILYNCRLYGLGLVTIHDPANLQTFEVKLQPSRSAVGEDAVDEFIETRFVDRNKQGIRAKLKDFCVGLP